ncbi:peptidoglycan DD-metalloendopeptidase family protein [Pannus brasiliensis CCIBt3594]|uniref:Peptidoglycan DD-metalloendopeptidase family protein n=1 Tax=Pannus brasiliensis CCIBt3594 TaxID=1427578 RepID=A0AAW9QMK5_9CHRO
MKLKDIAKHEQIDITTLGKNDEQLIKDIQQHLMNAGYLSRASAVDGIVGNKTIEAFNRFKKDSDLEYPNLLGYTTAQQLMERNGIFPWLMPTRGEGWISSRFGMRHLNGRTRMHTGVDVAADKGTPVVAIRDGVIIALVRHCKEGNYSCGGGYGNYVHIKHDDTGYESLYAHLDKVAEHLAVGKNVNPDEIIGTVGNTGHSFGSHLHFEIRKMGEPINPISVMRVV